MITTIDVLLFSCQNLLFGVYAAQIEEVLTAKNRANSELLSEEYTFFCREQELQVLDFAAYLKRKRSQKFLPCAGKTVLDLPDLPSTEDPFSSPKILVIKRPTKHYIGIQVEHVIKILTMRLDQIRLLPKIMEKQKQIPGLWGCTLVEEKFVMLIDLTQLT